MSNDYTPTWFEVREEYAQGDVHREAEFDRMLAANDAEVAAKALEEFAEFLGGLDADEDADVIMWVAERAAERAAEIRNGAAS